MNMKFNVRTFSELSTDELYEILKSRSQIFLLEQKIICQDLDDKDKESLHCYFTDENKVVAYLRAVTVGRVLTLEHKTGLGSELMRKSLIEIKKHFGIAKICVHAQKQAVGFYEKMGFVSVSDEYLEAGIAHISMEKLV